MPRTGISGEAHFEKAWMSLLSAVRAVLRVSHGIGSTANTTTEG